MRATFGILAGIVAATAFGAGPSRPTFLTVAPVAPVKLAPGKGETAVVVIQVQDHYHVQANPAASPQLIATQLEVKEVEGITVGAPVYPKGQPYRLKGAPSDIAVYSGKFEIRVPLVAEARAKAGKHSLSGTLKSQACDDKICYFPTTVPVTVPVILSK